MVDRAGVEQHEQRTAPAARGRTGHRRYRETRGLPPGCSTFRPAVPEDPRAERRDGVTRPACPVVTGSRWCRIAGRQATQCALQRHLRDLRRARVEHHLRESVLSARVTVSGVPSASASARPRQVVALQDQNCVFVLGTRFRAECRERVARLRSHREARGFLVVPPLVYASTADVAASARNSRA